jgi:hypothetical protein
MRLCGACWPRIAFARIDPIHSVPKGRIVTSVVDSNAKVQSSGHGRNLVFWL